MVFCSGVVALDRDTMRIIDGDVKARTVSLESIADVGDRAELAYSTKSSKSCLLC